MRYLITGGSGYIGTRLVELPVPTRGHREDRHLRRRPAQGRLPARRPSSSGWTCATAARCTPPLQRADPDVLVHLAFILNPSHDEGFMYEVDVNGTHNVLEAAAEAGIGQVLVTTSAVAYGAFPDNPVPLTEDHPVRGVARFSYARDKTESDRICQLWALQHPDRDHDDRAALHRLRPERGQLPACGCGRSSRSPPTSGNLDQQIQFVHEDDVVEAVSGLLLGRHAGAVQPVAGDGLMTLRECAELLGDADPQDAALALPRRSRS